MASLIYYRMFGYAVTLIVHTVNTVVMMSSVTAEKVKDDPENQTMASMQFYYLTVWNVTCQLIYAFMALTRDTLTLMKKEHLTPKSIRKLGDVMFESIVFPITMTIFTVFWPIFIYDRSLIFPKFVDRVFSFQSNCIIHLLILPVVLWELKFHPKTLPKSHRNNLLVLLGYLILYVLLLVHNYQNRGLWPYMLFDLIYGTIYFPIFCGFVIGISVVSYFLQWRITSFLWSHKKGIKTPMKKKRR